MVLGVTRAFSDDIAIDLGTANTLVHVAGRGVIIDEPSVVAVQNRGGVREVLAVGQKAKLMVGRTPESIETIRPLRDGVIADFIATEEMLRQFIKRAKRKMGFLEVRTREVPSLCNWLMRMLMQFAELRFNRIRERQIWRDMSAFAQTSGLPARPCREPTRRQCSQGNEGKMYALSVEV